MQYQDTVKTTILAMRRALRRRGSLVRLARSARFVPNGLLGFLGLSLVVVQMLWVPVRALPEPETLRAWVEEMKRSERGPFARIRWFCKDGTVLPPTPYACKEHGGGSQHGEWTDRVKEMRAEGFYIANILADLDVKAFVQRPDYANELNQILIEQFLINLDDGWLFRRARYYRGALQEESERVGARRVLYKLGEDQHWLTQGYAPLRIATRMLPHGAETSSVTQVRQLSASLAKKDERFKRLRNKIHVRPEHADAALVREYAKNVRESERAAEYAELASLIDKIYSAVPAVAGLEALADRAKGLEDLQSFIRDGASRLGATRTASARFEVTAEILAGLRDKLSHSNGPRLRIMLLDTSLAVEDEHFAAASEIRAQLEGATRGTLLQWLRSSATAVYGAGMISNRQLKALQERFERLQPGSVRLDVYKDALDYFALVPAWGSQRLRFHFFDSMHKLGSIEPLAALFIQDQLRGSPMFFYAQVLDHALRDANRLTGVSNELFSEDVGAGLRALNPGLARGVLSLPAGADVEAFRSDGIYLLPETTSELPPVAGILTAGEGNPLSHVQLLARNLGIPNVGIDERLTARLEPMEGKQVILAVSPAGSVRLSADDGQWDSLFGEEEQREQNILIKPDLEKLDLERKDFLPLSELRASDSGRVVGPKAAKLGELYHHYPESVAEGLTIPFGIFRTMLDQPHGQSGQSVYEWMVHGYRSLENLPAGSEQRREETEAFRRQLYDWILSADPGDVFRESLRGAMQDAFGKDGSYGVFVRSDTNVEDLPGFTGAGLNLTVPNVVGFEQVAAAISRVWASPFTARAFAWRQSHMDQPEHVYPAVLLMRSVPAEKSGVLVTQDIDTGNRNGLSVAVNEGVGGAVDGQAAESLRIDTQSGEVKLLAEATAPVRRRLNPDGGVDKVPVSDSDTVLMPAEIDALIELSRELPTRFPAIVDAQGNPAPADIEFGFLDGKLMLFQIRPFLESARAQSNTYLNSLDSGLQDLESIEVKLDAVP